MNLLQSMRSRSLPMTDWGRLLFNNVGYPYGLNLNQTDPGGKQENIGGDFESLVYGAYKSNGVVFACLVARQLLFEEARFQFRQLRSGRPGALFGTSALQPLETPWPGGTTRDLLARMESDSSLAGNWFGLLRPDGIRRLRPDWVSIILGSQSDLGDLPAAWDPAAVPIGYAYTPGGPYSGRDPEIYLPEQVAHYAPIPDPVANYRGVSWLTPVINEILGDKAMSEHKLRFFENGATVNLVVEFDPEHVKTVEAFDRWVAKILKNHQGLGNAYRTMFLGMGAKATPVGANLEELQFKVTQGAGETRIAVAARIPPIVVGLAEGLQAATYSNYGQARRAFADGTMRPLWGKAAGALASIIQVPLGSELWFDDRNISFLQEDQKDAAEILSKRASTLRTLIDTGFEYDAAVDAVTSQDLELLRGKHTGLVSVQLRPPGSPDPALNGNANGRQPALTTGE